MGIVERLVPDSLWDLFQSVAPHPPARPQGGGRRRADDRSVLAAILFVATTGCSWRQLPPAFGASWQTVHRRFTDWSAAGVWEGVQCAAPGRPCSAEDYDWCVRAIESARVRALTHAP